MQIVSALFVENFEMRHAPGPATRIDLTGAMFSMAAPEPVPVTIAPHLVALVWCPTTEAGQGVFEVVFRNGPGEDDEQIARNVSPFTVEPGKFTYRLVRGIFDSMVTLEAQDAKQQVATWMAEGYSLPPADALAMLPDAHWTNYAENREFFLNRNNPTNFERTFNTAYVMYRKIGAVSSRVSFDQIVDFSVIQKLNAEPKYANQKSTYGINFAPMSASAIQSESPEILTKTVVIHFFPNSWDLRKMVVKDQNGKAVEEMYDPNVDFVLEEIGKLAGSYGAARVVIEGHTDGSMRGQVPDSAVKELSSNRANAVKQELLRKFTTMDPNQFSAQGMGWSRPADASDAENHAKNRRVEVKVYPLEAQ